jgi:hypothetical protein
VAGRDVAGPIDLGPEPRELWLAIRSSDVTDGMVVIELLSETFRPSDHDLPDDRELGVVLTRVHFEPSVAPEWTRPLSSPPAAGGG